MATISIVRISSGGLPSATPCSRTVRNTLRGISVGSSVADVDIAIASADLNSEKCCCCIRVRDATRSVAEFTDLPSAIARNASAGDDTDGCGGGGAKLSVVTPKAGGALLPALVMRSNISPPLINCCSVANTSAAGFSRAPAVSVVAGVGAVVDDNPEAAAVGVGFLTTPVCALR